MADNIVTWYQVKGNAPGTLVSLTNGEAYFGETQAGYWSPPICLMATFNIPLDRKPKYIKFWLREPCQATHTDFNGQVISTTHNIGGEQSKYWLHKYRVVQSYIPVTSTQYFDFQSTKPDGEYKPSEPTDPWLPAWRKHFGSVWDNYNGSRKFKYVKRGVPSAYDKTKLNNDRWFLNPSFSSLVNGNVSDLYLHKSSTEYEDNNAFNSTTSPIFDDSVYLHNGGTDADPNEIVVDNSVFGTAQNPLIRTHFIYMSIMPHIESLGGTYNKFPYRISFIYV